MLLRFSLKINSLKGQTLRLSLPLPWLENRFFHLLLIVENSSSSSLGQTNRKIIFYDTCRGQNFVSFITDQRAPCEFAFTKTFTGEFCLGQCLFEMKFFTNTQLTKHSRHEALPRKLSRIFYPKAQHELLKIKIRK